MKQRYDLKDFRPETLTTSKAVAKDGLITDGELFYHLSSCPFFHTFNDGKVEEVETILLPFFRRFLKNKMSSEFSYVTVLGELHAYLANKTSQILSTDLKVFNRHFSNFYSLLHPSKKFKVLLPYFPYKYDYLTGCAEVVIETKAGIRIYVYDFGESAIDAEVLNFNGFRLQLAGSIFKKLSGLTPTSLACLHTGSKTVVYYTFKDDEHLEEMITSKDQFLRRYGSHCAYCLQKDCSPLLDRSDRFGWKAKDMK